MASGVPTQELVGGLGVRLPIATAKGYSRTFPHVPTGPSRSMYLEERKVAISVYDEGVRVSGTLELGARGLALSKRRLRAITAAAAAAIPGWEMPPNPADWAGMRPLSPDGLPYIGALPGLEGLHVAAAHAMLGVTLAPITGELLGDLIAEGKRRDPLLGAFDPGQENRPPERVTAQAGLTLRSGSPACAPGSLGAPAIVFATHRRRVAIRRCSACARAILRPSAA